MIIKRFNQNKTADFLAENKEDSKLEVGDLIKLEHLLYQIKGKYYSPDGFLFVAQEYDLDSVVKAKLPF